MERVRTTKRDRSSVSPQQCYMADEAPRLVSRLGKREGGRRLRDEKYKVLHGAAAAAAYYATNCYAGFACAAHNAVGLVFYVVDVVAVAIDPSVYP